MKNKVFVAICLLLLAVSLSANEFEAVITAYNKAELSGDVPDGVSVQFDNTNHSKGQITGGNKAIMSFDNLPFGFIDKIELFIKSNAKSGAGSVTVLLDNKPIASIPNSSFADWQDKGYTTTYIPITFVGAWHFFQGSSLTIEVQATENSLTWQKTSITYGRIADEPRTVMCAWLDEQGKIKYTALNEKTFNGGVILNDCEVSTLIAGEEIWTFAGWARYKITEKYTTEPNYYFPNEKYYPQSEEDTLYALYSNRPDNIDIVQTTTFKTGEYVLVMANGDEGYVWARGEVEKKMVNAAHCDVSKSSDGLYRLKHSAIPAECRYQLTFAGDSVQIKHLLSGTYLGYSGSYLSGAKVLWAWRKAKNHSVELTFGRKTDGDKEIGNVLWYSIVDEVFTAAKLYLNLDHEFVLLFDVSEVPTTAPLTKWTCYPFGQTALDNDFYPVAKPRKIMKNGVIYIEYNNAEYDIFGNKLN